jgi:hypothetical protein
MTNTTTPNSQLPTRQQLDEIDALLRRMLTLPPLTGDAAPPPPTSFPATPPVSEAIVRETTPPQDAAVRSWRVEWPQQQAASPPPSVVAWGSPVPKPTALPPWATNATPAAPPPPVAVPVVAAQPPQPVISTPPLAEPVGGDGGSFAIAMLKLVNGIFDILCFLLGPLGTWMRGPGRNALGWIGILMILAAGAWAFAEWSGYEWPRVNLSRFGIRP